MFFINYLNVNAQIDSYSLSFAGNYEVEVKRGNSSWTNNKLKLPLTERDSLHVIRGTISLTKNNKYSKPIPPILKTSVINAWNDRFTKSSTSSAYPWGIAMGKPIEGKADISFAFINNSGDSIVTIKKGDAIKAITIKQSSENTLYAYIYWVFPCDSDYIKMSEYLIDPVCVVKPSVDNEFFLMEPMAITRDRDSIKGSKVYIGISAEKKEEPILYDVTKLEVIENELKKSGLSIYSIEIKYNSQQ